MNACGAAVIAALGLASASPPQPTKVLQCGDAILDRVEDGIAFRFTEGELAGDHGPSLPVPRSAAIGCGLPGLVLVVDTQVTAMSYQGARFPGVRRQGPRARAVALRDGQVAVTGIDGQVRMHPHPLLTPDPLRPDLGSLEAVGPDGFLLWADGGFEQRGNAQFGWSSPTVGKPRPDPARTAVVAVGDERVECAKGDGFKESQKLPTCWSTKRGWRTESAWSQMPVACGGFLVELIEPITRGRRRPALLARNPVTGAEAGRLELGARPSLGCSAAGEWLLGGPGLLAVSVPEFAPLWRHGGARPLVAAAARSGDVIAIVHVDGTHQFIKKPLTR